VFRYFAWVTLLGLAIAGAFAQGEKEEAVAEALIQQRVEDWAKAVSAKDIERVLSLYAPDAPNIE
jgi:hypothetical protein